MCVYACDFFYVCVGVYGRCRWAIKTHKGVCVLFDCVSVCVQKKKKISQLCSGGRTSRCGWCLCVLLHIRTQIFIFMFAKQNQAIVQRWKDKKVLYTTPPKVEFLTSQPKTKITIYHHYGAGFWEFSPEKLTSPDCAAQGTISQQWVFHWIHKTNDYGAGFREAFHINNGLLRMIGLFCKRAR